MAYIISETHLFDMEIDSNIWTVSIQQFIFRLNHLLAIRYDLQAELRIQENEIT